MTFNVIDIIITVVLILFALAGYKKGLVGNIVGLVSLVASVILAWILYPIVSDMLIGTGIRDGIYGVVLEKVNLMPEGGITAGFLSGSMTEALNSGADTAIAQVAGSITDIIINIVSFLIVLVVSRIIIFIAEKTLKIAVKLPVLNGLNKIGGIIAGFLKGFIFVWVIGMLCIAVFPVGRENDAIKNSYLIEKFCYNNPIIENMIEEEQSEFEETESAYE